MNTRSSKTRPRGGLPPATSAERFAGLREWLIVCTLFGALFVPEVVALLAA